MVRVIYWFHCCVVCAKTQFNYSPVHKHSAVHPSPTLVTNNIAENTLCMSRGAHGQTCHQWAHQEGRINALCCRRIDAYFQLHQMTPNQLPKWLYQLTLFSKTIFYVAFFFWECLSCLLTIFSICYFLLIFRISWYILEPRSLQNMLQICFMPSLSPLFKVNFDEQKFSFEFLIEVPIHLVVDACDA